MSQTKTVSFLSFDTQVPDSLRELILNTTILAPTAQLNNSLAVAFRDYIADIVGPLYYDTKMTKEEALLAVAKAVGLDKKDMKPMIPKREPKKSLHHLKHERPFDLRLELVEILSEMFTPPNKK